MKQENIFRGVVMGIFMFLGVNAVALAQDCWMSVRGAGLKNGTAEEHAYPASKNNGQKCWNQTSPTGTMHVLEGVYSIEDGTFWIVDIDSKNDGPESGFGYKKLEGAGKVRVIGPRPIPYHAFNKEKGGRWIDIGKGAHHISISNFQIERVAEGIAAEKGGNHHLRIKNISFADTRQNIVLSGHPNCRSAHNCRVKLKDISHEIHLENISGVRYSKRHIRLSNGIHRVKVLNCHADSQFLDEDFAVGFDVENPSHDILFQNCTSKRNRYSLSKYWNGDGFKAENQTYNIRWINCSASENADGGFDIKTPKGYLQNVKAWKNNRNIRTWSPVGTTVKDSKASDSKHFGGEGSEAGIWSQGDLNCHNCMVMNNKTQVLLEKGPADAHIRFFDSFLYSDLENSQVISREDGTHINFIRTYIGQKQNPSNPEDYGIAYVSGTS